MPIRRRNKKGRAKGGIITAVKSLQNISIKDMNYQAVEIKLKHNRNK